MASLFASESGTDQRLTSDPWADYLISHVRYRDTEIAKVLAWEDQGPTIAGGRQLNRDQVLELLHGGSTVVTITRVQESDRHWRPDSIVRLITVAGREYIRTDAVADERDHLGRLAAF